jgi:YHS domain-containing protein
MERKNKKLVSALLTTGLLLVALVLINGCKKSEPGSTESASTEMGQNMTEHEHAAMTATDEATTQVAAATEQKICPVMGNPIDKNVFIEYQGKKVYFCCEDCKSKFLADPEKYIAKLPQFKK